MSIFPDVKVVSVAEKTTGFDGAAFERITSLHNGPIAYIVENTSPPRIK